MRRTFLTFLFLATLAAPTFAAGDFEYYQVRAGDTLESIAKRHRLETEQIVTANRSVLGSGQELVPGTILTLPEAPPLEKKPKTARKSTKPRASAASPAPGWGHAATGGGVVQVQGSPNHRNRFVGSDGRVMDVPTYVPPVDPEEEAAAAEVDASGRRTMASRNGRPIRGVLGTAQRFMGVPYVWGGEDPSGFDCSGFVQYVYAMHGVRLPRTADIQFNAGRSVPRGKEQPGDLVFFETYAPGASHVGIYMGGGSFIHASSVGFVRISSLSEDYFQSRYLGARRVY